VKKPTLFAFVAALALYCSPAKAQQQRQRLEPPTRSEPISSLNSDASQNRAHIDMLQAQREATELANTAQTIPVDVESLKKGILPKDVLQKLKQIEKLSKHLRSQLNQ